MLVSVKTAVERLSDDHSGHCGRHFAQVIKKLIIFMHPPAKTCIRHNTLPVHSLIHLFIRYRTREYDILKMNELFFMQLGTSVRA